MNVRIESPIQGGTVKAIASKSQAHRLLICAALSNGQTRLECTETSDDITATAECLSALGAGISRDECGFSVEPMSLPLSPDTKHLDCRESGSTLRFLLPVCCALGANAQLHMSGRLPARPLSPLLEELLSHGCSIDSVGGSPLFCSGQLESGEFRLAGNVSSQFISGLLLALPTLRGDSVIYVEGKEESKPYINMTLDALRVFGVEIGCGEGYYAVRGGGGFLSPGAAVVEGDWSNAAFWLCAGAIGKAPVTCTGLNLSSSQGDMAVTSLLERFGAEVKYGADSVTVCPRPLRGIRIDAGDTPDLVPVISAVASVAEGETVIYNAERLRIKESDRLRAVTETLSGLGADITETADGLTIRGKPKLKGGAAQSFGDHRIAMTAAVASSVCEGAVEISGAEAVRKSYPGFFDDFGAVLGGEVMVV